MLNHVTYISFMCMCKKLFFKFFIVIFISVPLGTIPDYVDACVNVNILVSYLHDRFAVLVSTTN